MKNSSVLLLRVALVFAILINATPIVSVLASSCGSTHAVQTGETIYSIGRLCGISPRDIVQANNLTRPDLIYVGQVLLIPGGNSVQPETAPVTVVQPPSQPVVSPVCNGQIYIVVRGDTLFNISVRFKTKVAAIKAANGLSSNFIYPGQRLNITGGCQSTTAVSNQPVAISNTKVEFGIAWPHRLDKIDSTLNSLKFSWFFSGARSSHPGYIPIARCGTLDEVGDIPRDYSGYLLVFNEPNLPEPNGCTVSPEEAANRYLTIKSTYPNAKLVVGNVSIWEVYTQDKWLPKFANIITPANYPTAWGIHGYVEEWITTEQISVWLTGFTNKYSGDIWITETGVCSGDTAVVKSLLSTLTGNSRIRRIAFYTDQQSSDLPWGICNSKINLINDGGLTDVGNTILNWINNSH